jgi:xylulokinase
LWRQFKADIYGTPIRRTVADEGPAYGAALLAGVASGTYADIEEATSVVTLREEITEPDSDRAKIYEKHYEIYRSLYPATSSAMSRLTDLAADSTGD